MVAKRATAMNEQRIEIRLLADKCCPLCGQPVDPERQTAKAAEAELFGHEKYALCPQCLQTVHQSPWTRTYKFGWLLRHLLIRERQRGLSLSQCPRCNRPVEKDRQILGLSPSVSAEKYGAGLCPECHQPFEALHVGQPTDKVAVKLSSVYEWGRRWRQKRRARHRHTARPNQ
jgi:uncharacterized protein (UPF0212 family)